MPKIGIDGIQINYDHYSPTNSEGAKKLVYIHGTGCNAKVFESHLRAMDGRYEAIAIDLPGHGESGGNGFRGTGDYAFFVGSLIEELGWDNCVIAGHSLGGGIALHVAIYFSERVSALMLIDTGARLRVSPKVLAISRQAAIEGQTPAPDSRLGYADSTPQAIVDNVNQLTSGCPPEVIYKDWIADDTFDCISRINDIRQPALAICGREDPLTPQKYHEFFRDKLPSCTLKVIEDAGHWPFVENPEAFNSAIGEFLDSLDP